MDEVSATLDDATGDSPSSAEAVTDELLDDDLLVEEISIDGMCGVY